MSLAHYKWPKGQKEKNVWQRKCFMKEIFKISGMNFKWILVAQLLALLEAVCFIACIDSWVSWNILCFLIVSVHSSKTTLQSALPQQTSPLQGENIKKKGRNSHQFRANAFLCICKTKALSRNLQHKVLRMKNDVLCIQKSAKMTAALVKFLLSGRK